MRGNIRILTHDPGPCARCGGGKWPYARIWKYSEADGGHICGGCQEEDDIRREEAAKQAKDSGA